ncbi:MAG: hypothetical protein ACRCST_16290 [Turicibacter sp.]
MRQQMKFHYIFIIFVGFRVIHGILNLLRLPTNILSATQAKLYSPSYSLVQWNYVVHLGLGVILGITAVPLFYALIYRSNFTIAKVHCFLGSYYVYTFWDSIHRTIKNNQQDLIINSINLLINYALLVVILNKITEYYLKRKHLFTVVVYKDWKEHFLAMLCIETNGYMSTHRKEDKR